MDSSYLWPIIIQWKNTTEKLVLKFIDQLLERTMNHWKDLFLDTIGYDDFLVK